MSGAITHFQFVRSQFGLTFPAASYDGKEILFVYCQSRGKGIESFLYEAAMCRNQAGRDNCHLLQQAKVSQ